MMGWAYGGMWLWMVFGFLLFVLFWGAIIWLIVWAIKKATERRGSESASQNALDIAKARYARGEITKEQFEQIKTDLS
jgi:putative membrane protein